MTPDRKPLECLVDKLRTRASLDRTDCDAIMALPVRERSVDAPGYIIREGTNAVRRCTFILSGFAVRHKLAANGGRQIVSLHMPGDFVDLQHLFLDHADHNVQALSRLAVIEFDREALQDLAMHHPAVGRALWIDALIDASIYREWVLNVGRRDARQRISHLLCEFTSRMEAAGLLERGEMCQFPMTQEQLGDATGLTSVHVNRTLKLLESEGLIRRDKRFMAIADWERMRAAAGFSAHYLHFEQGAAPGSDDDRPRAAGESIQSDR